MTNALFPLDIYIDAFGYQPQLPPVLAKISFAVDPCEIVGITGTSGCGKTTLLRLLAGLLAGGGGSTIPALVGSRLAYSPQEDILLEYRTVFENAALLIERRRSPAVNWLDDRQRLLDILALLRLDRQLDNLPQELSGGMRQRVQVAQALASHADLIMLDEPFAQQDRDNQRAIEGLLFNTIKRSQHRSAVLVSHDLDSLAAICDRTIFLGGAPASVLQTIAMPEDLRRLAPDQRRVHAEFTAFNHRLWAARAEVSLA